MDFESKEDKVMANPTEACACELYENEQGVLTTIQPKQEDGHWDAECEISSWCLRPYTFAGACKNVAVR